MLRESKRLERDLPGREPAARPGSERTQSKKRGKASERADGSGKTARGDAERELLIPAALTTPAIVPSPGTVTASIEPTEQPIAYTAFQAGLSLRSYRPQGRIALPLFSPYEMSGLGAQPMATLELRWTPFEFDVPLGPMGPLAIGGFAHVGYAQHAVNLRSDGGYDVDRAKLHSFETLAGAQAEWRLARAPRWSAASQLGLGRLDFAQAGSSSYSSASGSLPVWAASLFLQHRAFDRWTAFGGYQRLSPLRTEGRELRAQRDNWIVGVLGSFR